MITDQYNTVTQENWYDTGGSLVNTLNYTYDADGNVLAASSDAGTYTYTYDADGQVLTVQEPYNVSLTYGYDSDGNVISVGGGENVTYAFDADGHLQSESFSDFGWSMFYAQDWNADGQLSGIHRFANQANEVSTWYSYDAAGNVTEILDQNGSGNTLQEFQYSYDALGRVASETDNGVTTNYSYDASSQLTQAGSASYSYDANGNRTMSGYVVGADNLLQSDGTWDYSYDGVNNLVQKVDVSNGDEWTYSYDNLNRMTGAVERDSSGTVLASASYVYDIYGHVLQQTIYNGSTTVTAQFSYDGNNALTNGLPTQDFPTHQFFDNQGNLIATIKTHVAYAQWVLTDRLGSVRAVTNGNGTITATTGYDAYGNATNLTALSTSDGYGYTGLVYQVVTGLYGTDNRWYDPATGQWTTQDPESFAAGDTNLGRYVVNDPTNYVDPSGQEGQSATWPAGMKPNPNAPTRASILAGTYQHWVPTAPPPAPAVLMDPQRLAATTAVLLLQVRQASAPAYTGLSMSGVTPEEAERSQQRWAQAVKALEAKERSAAFLQKSLLQANPTAAVDFDLLERVRQRQMAEDAQQRASLSQGERLTLFALEQLLWTLAFAGAGQFVAAGRAGQGLSGADVAAFAKGNPNSVETAIVNGFESQAGRSLSASERTQLTAALRDYLPQAQEQLAAIKSRYSSVEATMMAPNTGRGIWDIASDLDRGAAAEARLGGRTGLDFQFPVIDRFENGVATSVKTMDLARPSYQTAQQITSTGQRYIDAVSGFRGANYAGVRITNAQITGRSLDLVVPPGATQSQRQSLQQLVEYGARQNPPVVVTIVEMQ